MSLLRFLAEARLARGELHPGALRCDPSETVDAICRPCAHECQARLQPTCSQSRRRTAGWPDSAPIMTAPPDGPGPAASDMPVHPYSEPKPQLDAPLHCP